MRSSIETKAHMLVCLSATPRIDTSDNSVGGILTRVVIFLLQKILNLGVFQQPARVFTVKKYVPPGM
jgi:hypothetical protein